MATLRPHVPPYAFIEPNVALERADDDEYTAVTELDPHEPDFVSSNTGLRSSPIKILTRSMQQEEYSE
jgi:hypothetical protein